jgi:hypothetical protein
MAVSQQKEVTVSVLEIVGVEPLVENYNGYRISDT